MAVARTTEFRAARFIFRCYMERMGLAISVLLAAKVNVGYWAGWMFADLKSLGQLLCQLPHQLCSYMNLGLLAVQIGKTLSLTCIVNY